MAADRRRAGAAVPTGLAPGLLPGLVLGLLLAGVTGALHAQDRARAGDAPPPPVPRTAGAAAVDVTVQELRFVPDRFLVGDLVELRIVVRTNAMLSTPAAPPRAEWVVVHRVDVAQRPDGAWEVRVQFSTFQPGVLTLPAVDVGPFRLENVRVQAASLLGSAGSEVPDALRPLRGQLPLPGTATRLVLLTVVVLAGPYLLLLGIGAMARHVRRWRAERARALPRLRLERVVRRLAAAVAPGGSASGSAGAAGAEPVEFFVQLSHALRDYLAARLRIAAHAATTREIREQFPELGVEQALGAELASILDTADRVKFAGRRSDGAEMRAIAARLLALVAAVDAALDTPAREQRPPSRSASAAAAAAGPAGGPRHL